MPRTLPAELNNNTNGMLSARSKITLMSISFWMCLFFMSKRLRRSGASLQYYQQSIFVFVAQGVKPEHGQSETYQWHQYKKDDDAENQVVLFARGQFRAEDVYAIVRRENRQYDPDAA